MTIFASLNEVCMTGIKRDYDGLPCERVDCRLSPCGNLTSWASVVPIFDRAGKRVNRDHQRSELSSSCSVCKKTWTLVIDDDVRSWSNEPAGRTGRSSWE